MFTSRFSRACGWLLLATAAPVGVLCSKADPGHIQPNGDPGNRGPRGIDELLGNTFRNPQIQKVKFQSELDQSWRHRRSRKAKLRSPELGGEVLVRGGHIRERLVRMVPDVEKFRAELKMHLFANRKLLDERQVPVMQSGAPDNVSSRVSESALLGVGDKSAGVEYRSGQARFSIRICDHIGPRTIENLSSAVGIGGVHDIVRWCEPITCLRRNNSGDLPVADDLVADT